MSLATSEAIEGALVDARPRAVAALCRYFRDLDRAEEAFQEACLRALRGWPERGLPKDPVAWLILVGRNIGIDEVRRHRRMVELGENPEPEAPEADEVAHLEALERQDYRDDVLRLMFVCCHPCLGSDQQIALTLRVVLGLTVPEIASALLVQPRAMEQRITRAKRRVKAAEVPFAHPTAAERRQRLHAVATATYLLFNEGYSASGGEAHLREPLCAEAIRLARLLLRLFPADPELMGLLALCQLHHSRYRARLDAAGDVILLPAQDRSLWNREAIEEGRVLLEKALRHRRPGPFQVQAAIAAVHAMASEPAATDWAEIDRLYAALERMQPSPTITLARAVAISEHRGAEAGLELLATVAEPLEGNFHFHGIYGQLLAECGELGDARREIERALSLARTPAEARHLEQRIRNLEEK